MRKLFASAVIALASMGFASAANAAVITETELQTCVGLINCNVGGVSLTGSAAFGGKTVASQFGLGVTGGENGEIDVDETMVIDFGSSGAVLNSFKVAFFYNGGEFNDTQERGQISVNLVGGGTATYFIQVTAEDQATLFAGDGVTPLGVYASCAPGSTTDVGSGCFNFGGNPLGGALIASITLTAISNGNQLNDSDFALAGLSYTPSEIPVPGAALLLLSGVAGLGFASRRRKAA